jgi:thiamine pyrophosphate-dependent acetolactate synthase large subunit-like protein
MERLDATRVVAELVGDRPIVASLGLASFDLAAFDRPLNFYVGNSMGLAASIAQGLALVRPELRVVLLDGDGSLLMNLGCLATASMAGIDNVVHIVWDNAGWEITGGQPAGSAYGVELETIARGSGFARTWSVESVEQFRVALTDALDARERCFICARVSAGGSRSRPPRSLVRIRERFMAALAPPPLLH